MAMGEINGDIYPDVVVTHGGTNRVGILLNTTGLTGTDLEVRLVANPNPANVAQDLYYTVYAANRGPASASSVPLTINLPNGVELVSGQDCSGTSVLTCSFSSILPGQSFVETIDVVPTVTGTLTTSANVSTSTSDLDPSNNTASVSTSVDPAKGPTVTLVESGNGTGTVVSNPSGISCAPRCFTSFASGTSVTLTASPDSVSAFAGWSGACTGTGTCVLNVTSDEQATATFNHVPQLQVTINNTSTASGTVTSSPAGINCPASCTAGFTSGTVVTLTASPAWGASFAGWQGACAGTTSACKLTMNADTSAAANFSVLDFSVSAGSASPTVQPGAQGTDTITVAPQGGSFGNAIQLSCTVSGPSPLPACGLSPTSVTPGADRATSMLTFIAPASASVVPAPYSKQPGPPFPLWVVAAIFGFTLVIGLKRRQRRYWVGCAMLLALFVFHAACGGNTLPKTYLVTVHAASLSLEHTTQITVTVP